LFFRVSLRVIHLATMAEKGDVTIRTRKFLTNRLLNRKQMILDVLHPGRANVSCADLKENVAKKFKVQDVKTIACFGFKTAFGGGKSTGFCLIYDNFDDAKAFEPRHRLLQAGVGAKPTGSRKMKRELKNRKNKVRGKAKAKVGGSKAPAAA